MFLTKYFEETEIFSKSIKFKQIRWHEIYNLREECTNDITREFFNYLIEEKMSTHILFNKTELNAISNFKETLAKMEEFSILSRELLYEYTDLKIRLFKHIELGNYGIITDFHNGKLWIGFYQYEDNDEMQLSISIEDVPFNSSTYKEMDRYFTQLNWSVENKDYEEKRTWFMNTGLSTFMTNGQFDANEALGYLKTKIEAIKHWL